MGVEVKGRTQSSQVTDEFNRQEVALGGPTTSFGEIKTAEVTPIYQIDAIYGVRQNVETFVDGGGSGSVTDSKGNFVCQTGTSVGGFGVVRSRISARYRPGQSLIFQWTALFDTANATALSLQAAGPFNSTNGFFVGYDGVNFGVMHRTDGEHEIRELTISTPAGGAETVSLTLNGVLYSIPVTSGTAAFNAYEIAEWLIANQTVWQVAQNNGKVVLFGSDAGPLSGAYSVSSSGALVGNITQVTAGVANTETWAYQSAFNVDELDGGGPSGMVLDPSKGNVYRLQYEFLGYGPVTFSIKDPAVNRFVEFHRFNFSNNRVEPNLQNPALKVGWISASLGSSTNLTVKGASGMAGLEGRLEFASDTFGTSHTNTAIGTTLEPVVSFRVRLVFQGNTNLKELIPLISYVSATGNKPVEVFFLLNPDFSSVTNWEYVDEDNSVVEQETSANTTFASQGTTIASFVVNGGNTERLSTADIGAGAFALQRGDILCIAARVSSGSAVEVAASLTWTED